MKIPYRHCSKGGHAGGGVYKTSMVHAVPGTYTGSWGDHRAALCGTKPGAMYSRGWVVAGKPVFQRKLVDGFLPIACKRCLERIEAGDVSPFMQIIASKNGSGRMIEVLKRGERVRVKGRLDGEGAGMIDAYLDPVASGPKDRRGVLLVLCDWLEDNKSKVIGLDDDTVTDVISILRQTRVFFTERKGFGGYL